MGILMRLLRTVCLSDHWLYACILCERTSLTCPAHSCRVMMALPLRFPHRCLHVYLLHLEKLPIATTYFQACVHFFPRNLPLQNLVFIKQTELLALQRECFGVLNPTGASNFCVHFACLCHGPAHPGLILGQTCGEVHFPELAYVKWWLKKVELGEFIKVIPEFHF